MARRRTLSEREREWTGYGHQPEFWDLMARQKRGEVRILGMAVGSSAAEWVLHYIDLQAPTAEMDLPLVTVATDDAW